MKQITCGTSGIAASDCGLSWADLHLEQPWPQVTALLQPEGVPRSVQIAALKDHRILEHRRNVIVSAPTNSGKSLVGLLVLLDAVRRGQRALLLEPLRALAREKTDELEGLVPQLSRALGVKLDVRISTGDYRLEDERFFDPPPMEKSLLPLPNALKPFCEIPTTSSG
jgi:ATP-dependent helicase YprA (DUF1998 family)